MIKEAINAVEAGRSWPKLKKAAGLINLIARMLKGRSMLKETWQNKNTFSGRLILSLNLPKK
jgi:hypothetical protein